MEIKKRSYKLKITKLKNIFFRAALKESMVPLFPRIQREAIPKLTPVYLKGSTPITFPIISRTNQIVVSATTSSAVTVWIPL